MRPTMKPVLVAVLVAVVGLAACSSDDDGNDNPLANEQAGAGDPEAPATEEGDEGDEGGSGGGARAAAPTTSPWGRPRPCSTPWPT